MSFKICRKIARGDKQLKTEWRIVFQWKATIVTHFQETIGKVRQDLYLVHDTMVVKPLKQLVSNTFFCLFWWLFDYINLSYRVKTHMRLCSLFTTHQLAHAFEFSSLLNVVQVRCMFRIFNVNLISFRKCLIWFKSQTLFSNIYNHLLCRSSVLNKQETTAENILEASCTHDYPKFFQNNDEQLKWQTTAFRAPSSK